MGFFSAVTGMLGAAITGKAASKAASQQQEGRWDAAKQTREQFEISEGQLDPWRAAGYNALEQYSSYLKPGGSERLAEEVRNTPGYKFQFDEGQNALLKAASARGRLGSGGLDRELVRYGHGMAASSADSYMNRLDQASRLGNTTTTNIAGLRESAQNNYNTNLIGAADARASGYMARADALNKGIGAAKSAFGTGFEGQFTRGK